MSYLEKSKTNNLLGRGLKCSIMYHIVDFMNKLLIYFVHSCHKAGSKISLSILQRNTNMKSFNKDNSSLLFKT